MNPHVMIDLETMSSRANAAIIEIGAVRFDFDPPHVYDADPLQICVSLSSNIKLGRHIEPSTVAWWMQQNDSARQYAAHAIDHGKTLSTALSELSRWINKAEPAGVWCHATFDTPILHDAYANLNSSPPWRYNKCYDLRTLNFLNGLEPIMDLPQPLSALVAHNALDDAIRQAHYAIALYSRIKKGH